MSPMNPRLLRPLARRQAPAPAPTDPYFSSVSLLLHMDGANESTTFTDSSSSPKTVTANGNAQISTAQSKFGGASGLFGGGSDHLAVSELSPFVFGTGDYTVECWIYPTATSNNRAIFNIDPVIGNGFEFFLNFGTPMLFFASAVIATSDTAVALNEWAHIAVARAAGTLRMFVNGIETASVANSTDHIADTVKVGTDAAAQAFEGYIDDLRVTKGVARYTANFTPPTAAFPNQ